MTYKLYIAIVFAFLYLWGVRNAWYMAFQKDKPKSRGERFLRFILLPLSWILVFGIVMIEEGRIVREQYYSEGGEKDGQ